MADVVGRRVRIHGQVQGVFFRDRTRQVAQDHGVAGWVANRRDGTVEAWLEGPPEGVDAVLDWIDAGGPPAARVTRVDRDEVAPAGHDRFEVQPH